LNRELARAQIYKKRKVASGFMLCVLSVLTQLMEAKSMLLLFMLFKPAILLNELTGAFKDTTGKVIK
jgi:hypothetical protein